MVDGGKPEVGSRDEGKHTGRNDLLFVIRISPKLVQYGTQVSSRPFHSQTYSTGSGRHSCFSKQRCQMTADTKTVLLTCCYKAASVGGMFSREVRL